MTDRDKTVQQKAQGVRSKSQLPNILQKGERKYANQQCHNLCRFDYRASSTTELSLKLEDGSTVWTACLRFLCGMSRERGSKTSDGEGKIKFESIYWRKGSRAYINVVLWFTWGKVSDFETQKKKSIETMHHIMLDDIEASSFKFKLNTY